MEYKSQLYISPVINNSNYNRFINIIKILFYITYLTIFARCCINAAHNNILKTRAGK